MLTKLFNADLYNMLWSYVAITRYSYIITVLRNHTYNNRILLVQLVFHSCTKYMSKATNG
jgi:hypothetical protein